ncbi:protein CHLOROPLAST IMPORT APPARATUS 2-like isoform X2 [Telopea speciosissima]|uniref:protein CHLOROPLAST IMPORT APPARATUS 2-like isoform X2 n=1 Tax=Telopea speciosissima TaxID=54955 RepID=UPI001CC68185|nr:protein CHLOROPLAST IMPORT APPARATUS 2-like isoform X2 [Telopea speciosissima]
MYSCISGGGLTYGIDIEIVKSPSTSSRTSHSSSPSSTLSESSNSSPRISTRKPRTPRKRPNQSYNEAAALLSTIYPNIFSTQNLRKPCRHTKQYDFFSDEFPELLPPSPRIIDNAGFLLDQQVPDKPTFQIKPKPAHSSEKPCQSLPEIDSLPNSARPGDKYEEDFDAESILDEEMEEGIDSIMGNLSVNNDSYDDSNTCSYNGQFNFYSGNQMGLGFGRKFGLGYPIDGGVRALRHVDDGDWWRFPIVDVLQISPKLNKVSSQNKKKKKKKSEHKEEVKNSGSCKENHSISNTGLSLKLNYDEVLNAWSDRGSPFSEEIPVTFSSGSDTLARLKQIDLFPENNGGVREASVMRYREKRRSRLFSKKIRYQVRKVNADQRPRMKARAIC